MKIIDCFLFYNEIDLLNYRLSILYDIVDYFILVESTHTFVGKEKKLFYQENKHLFEKFNDKIIHIIVDDFPYKYKYNITNEEVWINDRFQRNQIKRGIEKLYLNNEDILIITDLDEIPDPRTLIKIKNNEISVSINVLEMDLYHYNLNTIAVNKWQSARILSYEKYKELDITCNEIRFYDCASAIIKDGGWHLSYFGDSKFIKNKIENFAHQEYNVDEFKSETKMMDKINNFKNIFHDNGTLKKILTKDNNNLPYKYELYIQKFIAIT